MKTKEKPFNNIEDQPKPIQKNTQNNETNDYTRMQIKQNPFNSYENQPENDSIVMNIEQNPFKKYQ